MLPEFGLILFLLSLLLNIANLLLVIFKVAELDYWHNQSLKLAFLSVTGSVVILLYSFYTSDLSVQIVARFSNQDMPLIYRLCALWGGHEGAMLLWIWILSAYSYVLSWIKAIDFKIVKPYTISVLAAIYISFALFIVFTSNPFARYLPAVPLAGNGLNPLLQDVGMAMHPPMLYLGYVGLAVVFALSISALILNKFTPSLVRLIKPFVLVAWAALTCGIILGSWWAYRELGWGGWWFWDPVENASFMPWLVAMALMHMLLVFQTTGKWITWTALLAILGFVFSLLGTFLVRSGVLISVHAFAQDPNRGLILLLYVAIVMLGALGLIIYRLGAKDTSFKFNYSKSGLMVLGSGLAIASMLTVLFGTLYPIISQVLFQETIAVGAAYFNQVVSPLFLLAAGLAGLASNVRTKHNIAHTTWVHFFVSCIVSGLLVSYWWYLGYSINLWLIIFSWVGCWLVVASLFKADKKSYPMVIAHIGLAIVIIASIASSQFSSRYQWQMHEQDVVVVNSQAKLQLNKVESVIGPNYKARRANIDFIVDNGSDLILLKPEQQLYLASGAALAKVAIHSSWWSDIYVALGQQASDKSWAVRLMLNVGVRWIWFGGGLMILGMLLVLVNRPKVKRNA